MCFWLLFIAQFLSPKQTPFQVHQHHCYTDELFQFPLCWDTSLRHKSHKHTLMEREKERDVLQQAATCWGICLLLPVLYEISIPLKHWHSNTHSLLTWALPEYVCESEREREREREYLISRIGKVPLREWQMSFSVWLLHASNKVSHSVGLRSCAHSLQLTHTHTHTHAHTHSGTECLCICVQYMFWVFNLSKMERKPIPDATAR